MPLSQKFKAARKAAGFSQEAAGERLGVTQGYVSQIETGRLPTVPPDFAKRAALLFGLPVGHFGEHVSEQGRKATSEVGRYKEYGTVEAGKGVDEQADGDAYINLPERCEGADGVYRVKGISMKDAGLLPGDYLVVRRTDTPSDGDLVVAWTADFGAVVKRVEHVAPPYGRGSGFCLLTEGDDKDRRYPYILRPEKGDRIYAVVIAVFRQYKPKGKAALKPVATKSPNGKGKK